MILYLYLILNSSDVSVCYIFTVLGIRNLIISNVESDLYKEREY